MPRAPAAQPPVDGIAVAPATGGSRPVAKAAIVIDAADSVATVIADHAGGPIDLIGARRGRLAAQPVPAGHKVALRAIAVDEAVVKYGAAIGLATRAIAAGEHVHLHNCRSRLDARSATLDAATGAAQDTPYV